MSTLSHYFPCNCMYYTTGLCLLFGQYWISPNMCGTRAASWTHNGGVNFSLFRRKRLKSGRNLVLFDPALVRLLVQSDKRLFHLVSQEQENQWEMHGHNFHN